jgi:hypothetical protein
LYFSCKNYKELAQARITKVVGYFTTNPKKLVLHFYDFSVIFYAIYKNQQLTFTISDSLCSKVPGSFRFLTYVPLLCGKALRKNGGFAMGPLGAGRRRSGQIPAIRRPGAGGGGTLGPWGLIPALV